MDAKGKIQIKLINRGEIKMGNVKNIVIIFGGASSEYAVSLQSAYAVICNIDRQKYNPVTVGITQEGNWFYFSGEIDKIQKDTWYNEMDCVPVVLSPDRTWHRLIVLYEKNKNRIYSNRCCFSGVAWEKWGGWNSSGYCGTCRDSADRLWDTIFVTMYGQG
jgi:hypothetical protein